MLTSKKIESNGSVIGYAAGEFYNLPEKQAREWIEEGAAVDPDAPEEPRPEPEQKEGDK